MLLLWLVVLVLGVAYLAHRRTPPAPALGISAAYLILMGVFSHAPGWLLLVFWLLWLAVALPLALPDLRRRVLSGPLFAWFQKVLPPMSDTEREAIEAGTVWWDGELFSGRPDWQKLLDYPRRNSPKKSRPSSTARPKNSAPWSATGTSASAWTCRKKPGPSSSSTASSA